MVIFVSAECGGCNVTLLTWDFINFIQEFALDLLKHVILADLCVIARARDLRRGGGDGTLGGSHGHCGGTSGLGGCHGLWPSEQVELHS